MTISTLTGFLKYKRAPEKATLKSIPIQTTTPDTGITLLFGHRTREVMSPIVQSAIKEDYQIFNTEVLVDIGCFDPARRDVDDLPNMYLLDLMRTKRSLTDYISEFLVKYQEQAKVKEVEYKPVDAIRNRPKLLDKLMQEREFEHVGVVVWYPRVIDDPDFDAPVATLFRSDYVVEIRPRGCETIVTLNI